MSRQVLILVILACGCALLLTIQRQRMLSAERGLHSAQSRLTETRRNIDQLESLRTQDELVSLGQRPPQDVIARLRSTMTEAGVDPRRLTGVQADSTTTGRSIAGGQSDRFRTQTVRATLEDVSPGEVGRVLVAWRQSQRLWTTTTLTMTHRGGNDNRYRAELGFSAVYLEEAAQ